MKDKKLYWAIYLILAALVILLNALDVFPTKLSIINLIISILMGGIVVGSLIHFNFYGVFILKSQKINVRKKYIQSRKLNLKHYLVKEY